jgi:hypothetical protein
MVQVKGGRIMTKINRLDPKVAREREQGRGAILVCAYDDRDKCAGVAIAGSLALADLTSRLDSLAKDQELIFYCA